MCEHWFKVRKVINHGDKESWEEVKERFNRYQQFNKYTDYYDKVFKIEGGFKNGDDEMLY